jgi:hypothetical protein
MATQIDLNQNSNAGKTWNNMAHTPPNENPTAALAKEW